MVASAAPVTMLVAPGPTEEVHAQRRQPVAHPGVAGRGVHHGLLVAGLVVAQRAGVAQLGLQQRLAEPGHVAVAEDAEAAGEEPVLDAVPLAALRGQEPDQRLGDGEPHRVIAVHRGPSGRRAAADRPLAGPGVP